MSENKLDTAVKISTILNNAKDFIPKNIKELVTGVIISIILPIIGSLLKNSYFWIISTIIISNVLTICLISIFRKNKRYKGTFAVSALIFCNDDKLLLYKHGEKDRKFYVQPSKTYDFYNRKNKEKNLDSFYEKIYNFLQNELGMYMQHLEPIPLTSLIFEKGNVHQSIPDFIGKNSKLLYDELNGTILDISNKMHKYRNNEITISPILTIIEKNAETLKQTKEPFHIDFYFAFYLNDKNESIIEKIQREEFIFVSRKELNKMIDDNSTHGDLLAIYDISQNIVNNYKKNPKIQLNDCTFTAKKKTAYWRITESCNCNCEYCIVKTPKKIIQKPIPTNIIKNVKKSLEEKKIKKLVISGGEPLLVKNLITVLEDINKVHVENLKISVCTNGLTDFEDFSKINKIEKFEKFVISVDGFNAGTYAKYKKTVDNKDAQFDKVVTFIEKLRNNKIKYSINVILTSDLIEHIDKYIACWKNVLKTKDISISAIINNENINLSKDFISNPEEILSFYNDIINNNINDLKFLNKLDLILPKCTYFKDSCDCKSGKTVFYISPKGDCINSCIECI